MTENVKSHISTLSCYSFSKHIVLCRFKNMFSYIILKW